MFFLKFVKIKNKKMKIWLHNFLKKYPYDLIIWLIFFFISWNFYREWLPLHKIYFPQNWIFLFNCVYIATFVPFPYLILYLKKYFWKKDRIKTAKMQFFAYGFAIMLLSSVYFAYLDVLFLQNQSFAWILDWEHLLARVPYFIILSLLVYWLDVQRGFETEKKVFLEKITQINNQKITEKPIEQKNIAPKTTDNATFIQIKNNGLTEKIYFEQILFIEGAKQYLKIFTTENTFIHLDSLKNMENILPQENFKRVHKSYIINTLKIEKIQKSKIFIGKNIIAIGRNYKENLKIT